LPADHAVHAITQRRRRHREVPLCTSLRMSQSAALAAARTGRCMPQIRTSRYYDARRGVRCRGRISRSDVVASSSALDPQSRL
jgi:hypothetical protein